MINHRFVGNSLSKTRNISYHLQSEYEQLPVPTLESAVENLFELVPNIKYYVMTAKQKWNRNSVLLTCDEWAAIYLYTMQTKSSFCAFNAALRADNRQALCPWLGYIKLLMTALEKLPSIQATVWRGVNYDAITDFVDNDTFTWWGITSCSRSLEIVQRFVGESGTLFNIQTVHGKDISMFSANPDEKEVVLMCATRLHVKSKSVIFIGRLFMVDLEEISLQK